MKIRMRIKRFRPEDYPELPDRYSALLEHHEEEVKHYVDRLHSICDEVGHIIPPASRRGIRFTCMSCGGMFDLPHTDPSILDVALPVAIKSR